ncbi:MAG: tetratricopeptide repeat protein [Clostridia bacterium]
MAAAAPADEVRALVEAGKAADAYQLGHKTPEALGDPAFDFYFGVAAVESGHAAEGVLALERYVLRFPDNLPARLQLARAYFALGEDARARDEFDQLRRLDPPAEIAVTIDRFLDAIRLRETRYTTTSGAYLEAGFGRDTNVNAGPASANVFLQNLGSIILDPVAVKKRDWFTMLGAGGFITYPLSPGVALFGNAGAELKQNTVATQFDQGSYFVSGGVQVLRERDLYRLGVSHNLITIENDRYRQAQGLSGEWQHQLDETQAVNAGVQVGRYRYPGVNQPRDADYQSLTAGYRRLFAHAWQPILSVQLSLGREDALSRPDLATRDYWGGRAGLTFTPAPKWGVSAGYTYLRSRYGDVDIFAAVPRRDTYEAADAALTYLLSRNWSVRGEALVARNHSNIETFAYPRETYLVKIRYEFK